MTKLAICIFVCFFVTCIVITHAADEKYSSKYDDIDVNMVLATPRLRNQYVNCITGIAPCITGASRFLKEKFVEAFITRCKKCTDRQIYFFNAITEWFAKNEPETYNRIVQIAVNDVQSKNV